MHRPTLPLALAGLTSFISGCAAERQPALPRTSGYEDPVAYCAAVGTVDEPDARYVGSSVPEWLADALWHAVGGAPDAPASFRYNSRWRCDDGAVMACFVGANLPCADKADTATAPTMAERDYCREHHDAAFIPAIVTGRDTVFAWRCSGAEAVIERTVHLVDRRGYPSDFWYHVEPKSK